MADFLSPVVRRNVCCAVRISFLIQSGQLDFVRLFRVIGNNIYMYVPVCFTWRSKMNKFEYFAHHFWFVNFARPSLSVRLCRPSLSRSTTAVSYNCNRNQRGKRRREFICLLFLCWRIIALPVCYVLVDLKQRTSENESNFGCHFSQLWRWLLVFIWPSIRATYIFSPSLLRMAID